MLTMPQRPKPDRNIVRPARRRLRAHDERAEGEEVQGLDEWHGERDEQVEKQGYGDERGDCEDRFEHRGCREQREEWRMVGGCKGGSDGDGDPAKGLVHSLLRYGGGTRIMSSLIVALDAS